LNIVKDFEVIGRIIQNPSYNPSFLTEGFLDFYVLQHCFICHFSDSTAEAVLEYARYGRIEPRNVGILALAVRSSNHSARFHPLGQISSTLG
jgi:hypothetical protein